MGLISAAVSVPRLAIAAAALLSAAGTARGLRLGVGVFSSRTDDAALRWGQPAPAHGRAPAPAPKPRRLLTLPRITKRRVIVGLVAAFAGYMLLGPGVTNLAGALEAGSGEAKEAFGRGGDSLKRLMYEGGKKVDEVMQKGGENVGGVRKWLSLIHI